MIDSMHQETTKSRAGLRIQYTFCNTIVGRTLLGFTADGLCAVLPGQTADDLLSDLVRRFPTATISPNPGLEVTTIVEAINGSEMSRAIKIDLMGTPFQLSVWQMLMQIPRGQTWSYGELAARLGRPAAVRAVAAACGRNPVSVLVPCHRVVARNGDLHGYHWGIEMKKQLLTLENALPLTAV